MRCVLPAATAGAPRPGGRVVKAPAVIAVALFLRWSAQLVSPRPFALWQTQREIGRLFRDAELPFVAYNIGEDMDNLVSKWADDAWLGEQFKGPDGRDASFKVEVSQTNHFMYFSSRLLQNPNFDAPQEVAYLSWAQFMERAKKGAAPNETHFYLHARGHWKEKDPVSLAVVRDWPFFQNKESYWVVEPEAQHIIHCRVGMEGVISEAHYDGGRNFVGMARGHKRWVLLPPSECGKVHLATRGPFSRHSAVDWSDPTRPTRYTEQPGINFARPGDPFYDAGAIDVMLGPGEMLYVPSFWLHYVISLDVSIQCNSRSGQPLVDAPDIRGCGFRTGDPTELEVKDFETRREEAMAASSRLTKHASGAAELAVETRLEREVGNQGVRRVAGGGQRPSPFSAAWIIGTVVLVGGVAVVLIKSLWSHMRGNVVSRGPVSADQVRL